MLELKTHLTCEIAYRCALVCYTCLSCVTEHLVTGQDLSVISYNFLGLFISFFYLFTLLPLCIFFHEFSLLVKWCIPLEFLH